MTEPPTAPVAQTLPSTPFLLLDRDRLAANLDRVAGAAASAGVALRPHVKTHKSLRIARMQLDAGAVGITVATLGEAEVFVAGGCHDVLVAYPLWLDEARGERLRALAERARVVVGVDSVDGALAAARSLRGASDAARERIAVRVEIDCGQHRSGAAAADAGQVALAAARAGLEVDGVFTFPGHSYGPGAGGPAAAEEAEALAAAAASVEGAGLPCPVRSGGSTPSLTASLGAAPDGAARGVTELRPGVYALGDAQQWELKVMRPEDVALSCVATVVSLAGGRVVLDAGSKVLGADRPGWASGHGRLPDDPEARVVLLAEHHAVVEPGPQGPPSLGSRVRVVPNHVCTAVNLADVLHVGEGGPVDAAEPPWPVDARGRNA